MNLPLKDFDSSVAPGEQYKAHLGFLYCNLLKDNDDTVLTPCSAACEQGLQCFHMSPKRLCSLERIKKFVLKQSILSFLEYTVVLFIYD